MDWFDNWALTLAVFIPIVGMVIVLLIPKAEENLIKVVTLLATLLTGAVGIGILANFNLDDLGIWRRALTDYELLSVYNAAQNSGVSFDTYGPVKLDIRPVGSSIYVSWQSGTLLESTNVTGPWTVSANQNNPQTVPVSGMKFYRLRQ